ncbi:WD40-repeat-containing domain protein [Lipomyces arxii]|uniref:WD40-repeat-containing domain protein n=1 Tax=Lipomyces arxii TaxID=56418 RepID=UPI0034CFA3EC
MTTQQAVVPKYAHTPGLTRLEYSTDGKFLFTIGSNRLIRKFTVDSQDEPVSIEYHENDILAISTSKSHFATCSEDGTVALFSIDTCEVQHMLARQSLPIHDIAFSGDGLWVAIAGEDTTVKIVNIVDITRTLTLSGHRQNVKHLSYHPNGALIATSSTDGAIRIYSISSEEPRLIKTIENITVAVDANSQVSTKIAWHPDGRAFATQNKTHDVVTVSREKWSIERAFVSGHKAALNDFAWSPNGAYLATAGADGRINIWDTKTQNIIVKHDHNSPTCVRWHPNKNVLSFTTDKGLLYTLPNIIPASLDPPFGRSIYPAPLIVDPDAGGFPVREKANRSLLHADDVDLSDTDERNWIEDDDGAGYIPDLIADEDSLGGSPGLRKRPFGSRVPRDAGSKRQSLARYHEPFQPGSTPWKNERRYLALCSVGYIWTVQQDRHNTVTVSFFDKSYNREYHFTDHFLYDKACLTEKAALFASSEDGSGLKTRLFFRSHSSLVDSWDLTFDGESTTSIALSQTTVVVCSSKGYVRVYNLHGSLLRMYRHASNPVVCCASFGNLVMIVRDDCSGGLVYSIENAKYDETFQKNDTVDISRHSDLTSLFFSDDGDPCIFDSDGVLLVLMHWRQPLQAKWVPLLDTAALGRNNPGESFWPLGIIGSKFQCIILKGGEKYPYIPLPVSAELDIKIPTGLAASSAVEKQDREGSNQQVLSDIFKLEEQYLRMTVLFNLMKDSMLATVSGNEDALSDEQKLDMSRQELGIDKIVLQLLQSTCKAGMRGKAYGLISLIHKEQALQAAGKIAQRYEMESLEEKINRELEVRVEDVF